MKSLNESPDCRIETILHADETEVIARVFTYLDDEQLQYFARNHDFLTTDLHSTKARLGINQEKLGDFDLKDGKISYDARFWFYIPEYSVGLTIDDLMKPGLEIGIFGFEVDFFPAELFYLFNNPFQIFRVDDLFI